MKDLLTKQELIYLLELVHKSILCNKEEDFRELMEELRYLIPYDFAICVLGKKGIKGDIERLEAINISFPSEWLSLYISGKYHQIDPIIKENFTKFGIQRWSDTYKNMILQKSFSLLQRILG